MRSILLLSLTLIFDVAYAKAPKEYIGLVYPPLPSGVIDQGGAYISSNVSSDGGLWYANIEVDNTHLIWLTKAIGRTVSDGRDLTLFRVEDVLPLPTPKKGESIQVGYDVQCTYKGQPDLSIIEVGEWESRRDATGHTRSVRLAWRVNPGRGKFEAISPKDVACELSEDRN